MQPIREKRCRGACKKLLPLNAFHNNKRSPDGKNRYCKACQLGAQAERLKNPHSRDKRRESNRRYREKKRAERPVAYQPPPGKKICSNCKDEQPYKKFNKLTSSPDGFAYNCKVCNSNLCRAWRAINREAVLRKSEYNRKFRERKKLEKNGNG